MLSHSALARTVRNTCSAKTSGQSLSPSTAAMKASVTRTEVEVAQPSGLALGGNEGLDVGMVAPQRRHHGAAAGAGGNDGAAHCVPYIYEGQWPRGVGALDRSAFGPERREVVADAAALLHRECCFAQVTENAAEVVLDVAHHEAVEQRNTAPVAGQDPSRRQEVEILER